MTHQLINFNIPTSLKDSLDEIAKTKRLSRTAISFSMRSNGNQQPSRLDPAVNRDAGSVWITSI